MLDKVWCTVIHFQLDFICIKELYPVTWSSFLFLDLFEGEWEKVLKVMFWRKCKSYLIVNVLLWKYIFIIFHSIKVTKMFVYAIYYSHLKCVLYSQIDLLLLSKNCISRNLFFLQQQHFFYNMQNIVMPLIHLNWGDWMGVGTDRLQLAQKNKP